MVEASVDTRHSSIDTSRIPTASVRPQIVARWQREAGSAAMSSTLEDFSCFHCSMASATEATTRNNEILTGKVENGI